MNLGKGSNIFNSGRRKGFDFFNQPQRKGLTSKVAREAWLRSSVDPQGNNYDNEHTLKASMNGIQSVANIRETFFVQPFWMLS